VVALLLLAACGGTATSDTGDAKSVSHTFTTPHGTAVVLTANATTAGSGGQSRPSICGDQRGKNARTAIDDEFCVYPGNDGRSQGGLILSGSKEPDIRIVASAAVTSTGVRFRPDRKPSIAGELLRVPRSPTLRLALIAVPETALPGTVELISGQHVQARYRLNANPCQRRGTSVRLCATPIDLDSR
jgi:hypothetical protein